MSRRKKGNDNTAVGILVLAVLMVIAIALGWYGLQIEEAGKTTTSSSSTTTRPTSSASITSTATNPTNTTSQLFTVVNMTTTSTATNASTT